MRRRMLHLVAIVTAGAALSGCFALRGFTWSAPSVTQGRGVTAVLELRPGGAGESSWEDIPFVLVGLPQSSSETVPGPDPGAEKKFSLGRSTFDTRGEFGGPTLMIRDPALHAFVLAPLDGRCKDHGQDAAALDGFVWRIRRTPEPVDDGGRIEDVARTTIRIRAHDDAPLVNIPEFAFFSGRWADDGDRVPEGGEVSCTGLMMTSLPVVAPPE